MVFSVLFLTGVLCFPAGFFTLQLPAAAEPSIKRARPWRSLVKGVRNSVCKTVLCCRSGRWRPTSCFVLCGWCSTLFASWGLNNDGLVSLRPHIRLFVEPNLWAEVSRLSSRGLLSGVHMLLYDLVCRSGTLLGVSYAILWLVEWFAPVTGVCAFIGVQVDLFLLDQAADVQSRNKLRKNGTNSAWHVMLGSNTAGIICVGNTCNMTQKINIIVAMFHWPLMLWCYVSQYCTDSGDSIIH